ncbi:MAG: hypothetical protein ACT4OX_10085 [Actinomycetota bacterium]
MALPPNCPRPGISNGAQSTGIRGLYEQGAIDVTALYSGDGTLSSVTAVVTTEAATTRQCA